MTRSEPPPTGGWEAPALMSMSSVAGSPASPSRSRGPNSRKPTRDGSGPPWPTSSPLSDPDGSSPKTSPASCDEGSVTSSETWPRSGSMRSGTVSPLPPSAPLTDATESSSLPGWPTPTTLTDAVQMFPTPKATDGERGGRGDLSMTLRQGKTSHRRDWPTPTAAAAVSGGSAGGATGPNLLGAIRAAAAEFPTPTARDWKGTGYSGQLPTVMSGLPSPEFVEWLMGFPIRWTDSDRWETPLFPR